MARNIHTDIVIDATPQTVWAALVDVDSYPEWNPYHVHVEAEGALAIGRRLVVLINKPNGEQVKIRPHVIRIEPGRVLTWGGGIRGIFRGEHHFILEPCGDGTHLIQSELFEGFAVRYASLDAIEEGYDLMNRALKEYVESTALNRRSPSAALPGPVR